MPHKKHASRKRERRTGKTTVRRSTRLWIIIALVVVATGVALWFYMFQHKAPGEETNEVPGESSINVGFQHKAPGEETNEVPGESSINVGLGILSASIYCIPINTGREGMLSGNCTIFVKVVNYSNDTIAIYGISVSALGKPLYSHSMNETLNPGETRNIRVNFYLDEEIPANTLIVYLHTSVGRFRVEPDQIGV
ncbi:MAG: hypothetical protein QXQ90_00010 [Desulfurococcaceae archaeon]